MKINKKTAYISWYFSGNLGDDILVANFINQTSYDNYVIIGNPYISKKIINFSKRAIRKMVFSEKRIVFMKDGITKVFGMLKNNGAENHLIYIGGSIWPENSIINKTDFMKKVKSVSPNTKIICIGNNISNYINDDSQKLLECAKEIIDIWTLRDSYSSKYIGIDKFYPDPIYALDPIDFVHNRIRKKDSFATLTLSEPAEIFNYKFSIRDTVKDVINDLELRGINKLKILFYQDEKDQSIYFKILDILEKSKLDFEIVNYRGNYKKIFKYTQISQINYAIRFHSIVLSNLLGKKTIAFDYDNKNINHLKDLGYEVGMEFFMSEDEIKSLARMSKEQFDLLKEI